MDVGEQNEPFIDAEVKAFIFSLVSALGGTSAGDDGLYVLGDDALAVLKDIKRWLRLYDDKLNRLDVARLLADANLVKGDLLEILSSWPEDAVEGSFRSKMAVYCVDLLTQLTWPIEQDVETATLARYLHVPTLQKAHAAYKSAVINHPTSKMLRTIARVCLPSLAQPKEERSPHEDTIIKVVLYFFRNIAMITQPKDIAVDELESGIDRSTTIDEFHYQDIFALILAICSNMHEDYSNHDVEVLDIVFHLVKGVDTEDLFLEEQELISANTRHLKDLMGKEKGMHASYARHAPSRHNRFGTMLWVGRDDGKRSTLFGQKAAGSEQLAMNEIDASKKWKRPRRPVKKDDQHKPQNSFDPKTKLTSRARRHLRQFVEQFLDSSFNPLLLAVRRAIEREAPRVLKEQHMQQYLYLIAWLLRAECARRKKQAHQREQQNPQDQSEIESFSLIATVLNQETFVLLNRAMQTALDDKKWQDLNAGMKCFTQILLTVQEMSQSPLDEDQEIAENILNRIFYEQTTHDRIIALLRSYQGQEFGYLDACTELAHVFLRLLERYSKENVDMQVRSRRRARRVKKRAAEPSGEPSAENEDRMQEVEDVTEAQVTSSERKFEFNKFSAKFISQASVDTFVALLRYYQDLTDEQLKRAHRFFYRVAFKMELTVYVFRMDIVQLLNKLVRGPEGLNQENPTFKDWEELVRQIFRRLVKRMEDRPALAVELLFSKIPSTMYYLEHGYDKEEPKKTPRAAAELEMKPGLEMEEQLGVAVSILINQSKFDALAWVKSVLKSAVSERKAWEEANIAISGLDDPAAAPAATEDGDRTSTEGNDSAARNDEDRQHPARESSTPKAPSILLKADNDERTKSLHQDKHLRLLLAVLAFERLSSFDAEATETTWFIPSSLSSATLSHNATLIGRFEYDLPTFEDGRTAEDMIRRKTAPRPTRTAVAEDEDSEGTSGTDIEEHLYPPGGPTLLPASRNKQKQRLLKRQRRSKDDTIDDDILEARRNARRKAEAEKNAKIKSQLYIRDSDDESDEERDRLFFEREREMREKVNRMGGSVPTAKRLQTAAKGRKRREARSDSDATSSDGASSEARAVKRRKAPQRAILLSDDEGDSGSEVEASDPRHPPLHQSSATHSEQEDNPSTAETDTETPQSSTSEQIGSSQLGAVDAQDSAALRKAARDVQMVDPDSNGSDKDNAQKIPQVMPARRSRAFVIESDSDD